MSSECLKMSKALKIANKRIDELEKYNLDLANESHNKSLAIDRANERVRRLEKICKGLCKPLDSKPNNRAFDDWIEYTEQLRKEQNQC